MSKADEIRSMVANLKSRTPEEVMGQAATSNLLGSVVTAAIGTLGFVIAATVLVFVISGPPEVKKETAAAEPAPAAEPKSVATQAPAATTMVPPETEPKSDTDVAVEKMGIGETKDPDAAGDSLENRIDDLLKGIE